VRRGCGVVADRVRGGRDRNVGRVALVGADLLLEGDIGLVVMLLTALADLAGYVLVLQLLADGIVVAGAVLAVCDGGEDVSLHRLGELLHGAEDVLVALVRHRGGAVVSSDIRCQSQRRGDVRGGSGRHFTGSGVDDWSESGRVDRSVD